MGVAVDAGHGGSNLGGSTRTFVVGGKTKRMVEKTYTCDIVARLILLLEKENVAVGSTTRGKCMEKPRNFSYTPWPISSTERFSTTGGVVNRSASGLMERVFYAKNFFRDFERKRFVSVHVDFDKKNPDKSGAFILVPQGCPTPEIALRLAALLEEAGLAKKFESISTPIVVNGTHGYQNILILREAPVCESMLVEVANINNLTDRQRLRDPKMRQKYAELIAKAILG